jgi:hypothetical protein
MALLWTSHLCSPVVAVDGIELGGGVKNGEEGKKEQIEKGSGHGAQRNKKRRNRENDKGNEKEKREDLT